MALTYSQLRALINANTTPIVDKATKLREIDLALAEFASQTQYSDLDLEYDPAKIYGLLEADKYAESSSRIWKAKQDSFSGQAPPTDPAIDQNFYWEAISEAESSTIKEWSAGLFGSGLIIVDKDGELYKLDNANRPFESNDFAAELANGDWVPYLQIDNSPVDSTGSEINFDKPRTYGTNLAPITTATLTDAGTKRVIQNIYHQAASFNPPASWVKLANSAAYKAGVLNLITVEFERVSRKIYSITQDD